MIAFASCIIRYEFMNVPLKVLWIISKFISTSTISECANFYRIGCFCSIRKSKDYVYGIWVYKSIWYMKRLLKSKKWLVSCMKSWTEARYDKYMKYHSKLTYQLSFWNVSRKVDYHAGGKWFIYGPIIKNSMIIFLLDMTIGMCTHEIVGIFLVNFIEMERTFIAWRLLNRELGTSVKSSFTPSNFVISFFLNWRAKCRHPVKSPRTGNTICIRRRQLGI